MARQRLGQTSAIKLKVSATCIKRFFPWGEGEVQAQLCKELGLRADANLASVKRGLVAYKPIHEFALDSRDAIKGLMLNKDSQGYVVKTQKTGKPAYTKNPSGKICCGIWLQQLSPGRA